MFLQKLLMCLLFALAWKKEGDSWFWCNMYDLLINFAVLYKNCEILLRK